MAHEVWSDSERDFYKENRSAVDRNIIFRLGKKVMKIDNPGYSSVGDYISDLILKEIHLMQGELEFSECSPTIAHYIRREKAKKAEIK